MAKTDKKQARKKTIQTLIQALKDYRANASSTLQSNLESQPTPGVVSDEEAQLNEQLEISSQLAAFGSGQLLRINDALDRAENGRYGVCDDCDEEINITRLTALPYVTRCLKCQIVADNSNGDE